MNVQLDFYILSEANLNQKHGKIIKARNVHIFFLSPLGNHKKATMTKKDSFNIWIEIYDKHYRF